MKPSISFPSSIKEALQAVRELYICIPRLIRLVRAASRSNTPTTAFREALVLAQSLYTSSGNPYIVEVLTAQTSYFADRSEYHPAKETGSSYSFSSLLVFVLATQYYAYRTLLCGLIQTLCMQEGTRCELDIEEVQREDVSAATSIAMCVSYVLQPARIHPTRARRLEVALQISFGAWHRLGMRPKASSLDKVDQASYMKAWIVTTLGKLENAFGGCSFDYHKIVTGCEFAAGGPRAAQMSTWIMSR